MTDYSSRIKGTMELHPRILNCLENSYCSKIHLHELEFSVNSALWQKEKEVQRMKWALTWIFSGNSSSASPCSPTRSSSALTLTSFLSFGTVKPQIFIAHIARKQHKSTIAFYTIVDVLSFAWEKSIKRYFCLSYASFILSMHSASSMHSVSSIRSASGSMSFSLWNRLIRTHLTHFHSLISFPSPGLWSWIIFGSICCEVSKVASVRYLLARV